MVKESVILEDVQFEVGGDIIGGSQSVSITYTQENKPIHAGGSKKPREIRNGPIAINGTVEELWLDNNQIKDLIDTKNGNNPYFNIVGTTINKDPARKVTIVNAKFKGFTLNLALNDETKLPREFDALDILFD